LLSAAFFLTFIAICNRNLDDRSLDPNISQERFEPPSAPPHQPIFNLAATVVALIGFCTLVHLVRIYLLTPEQDFLVFYYGAFIPARYGQGVQLTLEAVTSIVSYSLIHGSFPHLLTNCLWLAVFGSPLANTIGAVRVLSLWIVCSACAALFHYLGQPNDTAPMIGASGAVAGFMGAAARFGFAMNRRSGKATAFEPAFPPLITLIRNRSVLKFLGVFLASNLLIGSGQFAGEGASIAWQAHIGGIVAGFLLIPLFSRSISRN
jgi:membrane associated rhomboid family serine protease